MCPPWNREFQGTDDDYAVFLCHFPADLFVHGFSYRGRCRSDRTRLSGGVAGLLHHHGSVFSKERLGKENLVKKETLNEQVSVLAAD